MKLVKLAVSGIALIAASQVFAAEQEVTTSTQGTAPVAEAPASEAPASEATANDATEVQENTAPVAP